MAGKHIQMSDETARKVEAMAERHKTQSEVVAIAIDRYWVEFQAAVSATIHAERMRKRLVELLGVPLDDIRLRHAPDQSLDEVPFYADMELPGPEAATQAVLKLREAGIAAFVTAANGTRYVTVRTDKL